MKIQNDSVHTKVIIKCSAKNGQYQFVVKLDKQGKIDDFNIENYYADGAFLTPPYDLQNYTEKQVTIGNGEFALPGILTTPKGKGPFPVVVLVHGSGSSDMDESMFAHRPFQNFAVGLASEGIAVLRYDKRTRTHAMKFKFEPNYTINEETVDDANLAVNLLKKQPKIDNKQIFVLGHSQGGFALPKII